MGRGRCFCVIEMWPFCIDVWRCSELCQVELGPFGFHGCQLHGAVLEKLIVYQIAQKSMVFKEPQSAPVQNTGASWWPPWTQLRYDCHQHTLLWVKNNFFFFPVALRPNIGQGHLILEVFRSHNEVSWSVGLLWLSDQLVTETSTCKYTTLITDEHSCPRRDSNPQCQQARGCSPMP
jgi:hypothetical protein